MDAREGVIAVLMTPDLTDEKILGEQLPII